MLVSKAKTLTFTFLLTAQRTWTTTLNVAASDRETRMTSTQEDTYGVELKIAAAYGRLLGEARWCASTGKVTSALADTVREMEEAIAVRTAMIARWTQDSMTKEVK